MKSKRGWIATNRLKTNHLFGSIFPRDEKIVDTITDHMKVNGYDQSQPIVVWDRTEEENNRHALYIVDGHTRKCAAVEAGISPVYVAKVKFSSEKEALQYAIHNQRDRRNLTEADLTRFVLLVDSRKPRGGDRKSEAAKSKTSSEVIDRGKSSAQTTAEVVGTTKSKVEKIRTISDHADDQTKQAVEAGSKSINQAYQETQEKRRKPKGAGRPKTEVKDTLYKGASDAMNLAVVATSQLERIQIDDPLREQASDSVITWIEENRKKEAK